MRQLTDEIRKRCSPQSCFAFGRSLHVSFSRDDAEAPQRMRAALTAAGFANLEIEPITPGIEDCFIHQMR